MKTFATVSVVAPFAAMLAAALAWAGPLPAQLTGIRTTPPTIESIEPLGIARGVTEELTIEGYNLRGASAIFFSDSTVKGRILGIKEMPDVPEPERLGAGGLVSRLELGPQPPRYQVSVEVDIDAEADPGPVRFRFQTPMGTSPAGKFLIEPYYGERPDAEPNDTLSRATKTFLPAVLSGTISRPGDEDHFEITVDPGQELVFEEAGIQIGSKLKAVVTILSPGHTVLREFGRNHEDTRAVFSHRFEQGGTYYVRVSDYEKSGGKGHFYRLKIGSFPFVTSAYPLGIRRGESAEISLNGFNLGAGKFAVEGKPSWKDESRVMFRPETDLGRGFSEVKLALGDDPEVESRGDNTSAGEAQAVTLPVTVNGRIASAVKNQGHHFRFTARKDQVVLVDVNAARLGSKLDSVVDVLDASGKPIEQASVRAVAVAKTDLFDHTSKQSQIRFEMSKDIDAGDYLMLGSEIVLLTRMPRQPDEGLALESFPPEISGRRTQGAVRMASLGTSTQAHAKGTPMYKVQIHPPGKRFPANGLPFVRVYYTNDDGRFPYGRDSFLKFKAPAHGEYVVRIRDSAGRGGERFSYRLALRGPREDFRLFADPKTPNVPRGERVPLTVTAYRFDGFDGDIKVSLAGLPPGIQAEDSVIPGGQLLTTILLRADADAEIGKSTLLKVKGVANIGGKQISKWANPGDNLKFISVIPSADVVISADTREVILEPGQNAKITVSVVRKNGFDGRVPVEVLNLPPHTDTPEVGLNSIMITEEKSERTFSVSALPDGQPMEQKIYLSGSVETRSSSRSTVASEAILVKIVPKSKGTGSAGSGGE
jgi:hypothetical protein